MNHADRVVGDRCPASATLPVQVDETSARMRGCSGRLLLLLCSLAASCAFAQRSWSGLHGTVSDISGAAVPGAEILVSGNGLPAPVSCRTDSQGFYSFDVLPVGRY
ncbi:MAG TPA: carboxypeptidase-like regulatory domain-containing protein, partial [Bryobacteraceae bacterium]|nr:carboxypeptidase-like regulatory domain-containing protein [Bryobacteraceae bacterium]